MQEPFKTLELMPGAFVKIYIYIYVCIYIWYISANNLVKEWDEIAELDKYNWLLSYRALNGKLLGYLFH